MATLQIDTATLRITSVKVTDDELAVELADGRFLAVPIDWYPRLVHGSSLERNHYEFLGGGRGIHWPYLDEDISLANLVGGQPSGESERSFQHWLAFRAKYPDPLTRPPQTVLSPLD